MPLPPLRLLFPLSVSWIAAGSAAGAAEVRVRDTAGLRKAAAYAIDEPSRSRPDLPSHEEGGIHGRDPLLADPEKGDFTVREGSPAAKAGAHGLPRGKP